MKNPTQQKYKGKSVDFLKIGISIFLMQNAINTFDNLYYDYWNLITKFWPGSSIRNTPFRLKPDFRDKIAF